MKLSTRARYAIRCMIAVAKLSENDEPVSLQKVSQISNISRRYLEQLAISLKSASLVRAVSGRKGGYILARPASEIRVGEIVEASIGKINIVECVLDPAACDISGGCGCRSIYEEINNQILAVFNKYSLEELAENHWASVHQCSLDIGGNGKKAAAIAD